MDNSFRKDGKKGGRIALVYNEEYRIKRIKENHLKTYHSVKWKLIIKNTILHIIGVYRPPTSGTVNQFAEEFLEKIQDDIMDSSNLIILGDFNIHINDEMDEEAASFKQSMNAIGLIQHVDNYTHRQGNILDHVYTFASSEPTVLRCNTGSFISDHCIIITNLAIQRGDIKRTTKSSRKYKNFILNDFKQDLIFNWSEQKHFG